MSKSKSANILQVDNFSLLELAKESVANYLYKQQPSIISPEYAEQRA